MADERIDIEIVDKVSPSISAKIQGIAKAARDADSAINKLKAQLSNLNSNALTNLQNAVNGTTAALSRNALANQRLATELQNTARAAANAQAAQTRATNAQAQGATAAQRLATEQQRTAAATANAQAVTDRAALAALRLQQAQNRVAASANNAGRGIMNFVRSAAALIGVGLSANAILESADAYTTLQNKLKNVAEGEAGLVAVTEEVFEVANRTRNGVQETAQAFTRFDMALKGLGASQTESLRLTETINKSLIVSGATSGEAASGLLQLSQAFNKGKLDGDEFRSVMELMPVAADAIAKELKVTRGELLKLAPEGKITAEIMRKAFAAVADEMDKKFSKTMPTIGQAMTVLKNNAVQTFGEINKALGITEAFSKAIIFIGKNMKAVALGVAVVGAALAVAFGPALVGMLAAATSAIWAFTLAIASNPIGLLIVGITAAVSAIALFGDEIAVSEDGLVTLKDTALSTWSFIAEGFGVAASFIKDGWNVAIDYLSEKTNGWGEQFRNIGDLLLKHSKNIINGYIGLWVGAYNSVVAGWRLFPAAMRDIFVMALNSVVTIAEKIVNAALEGINKITELANSGAEALGLDKIFEGDLSVSLGKYKMEVTGAASDLAGKVKGAFASAFNTDFVGNAVAAIEKRAREISAARIKAEAATAGGLRGAGVASGSGVVDPKAATAALKRADALAKVNRNLDEELQLLRNLSPEYSISNRMLELENNLLNKKIQLTDSEKQSIKAKLQAIQDQKASNAIAEINDEISEQLKLLSKVGPLQIIAQQMQQHENDLKKKGIELSQQERAELQNKLTGLQQQFAVNRELNSIYRQTQGAQLDLQNEAAALNQAYKDGIITLDQYSNRLVKLSVNMAKLKLEMGDGTLTDFATASLGQLVMQYEGVMSGLSDSFGGFFQSFTDGFANSVGRAIVYSEDLNDALGNVAREAVAALISSLVKLGIQWAVNAALGNAIGAASLTAATTSSVTAAGVTATAWAPAAALVSLASFGANSVPAMAGIASTTALSESLALASMAGFEKGGFTGNVGKKEIAGVVHGQEFVMNANATARNRPQLEAMNRGATTSKAGSGAVNVTIENYGTSKDFEVQQISETDVRIIARDEARQAVRKETPGVVAAEIRNPNSSVSKSLGQSTQTQRRRS